MPYGIKDETPEITAKMESCVNSMLARDDFRKGQEAETRKSSAIAICKASIMKSMSSDFTYDFISLADNKTESNIEILRTGEWNGQKGKFAITEKTLNRFIENYQANVYGNELQVNFGHEREGEAAGWIKKLYKQGNKLLATVSWTTAGLKTIKDKIYRYISAELAFDYHNEESGKTFKDVLIGAALTNVPYVRGLAPVQLSESLTILFSNLSKNMETIKIYLSELRAKKSVSASEFATLKKMFITLDEEQQTELKPEVEKVEEKVEESKPEGDEKPAGETPPEAPETKQPELSEGKKYSAKEVRDILSEQAETFMTEITKVRSVADSASAALRKRAISEKASELMLSESNTVKKDGMDTKVSIGLPSKLRERVEKFMSQLRDDLHAEFVTLMKSITKVDFAEHGHGVDLSEENKNPEDVKLEKAKKLAEEKKISLRTALDLVEQE